MQEKYSSTSSDNLGKHAKTWTEEFSWHWPSELSQNLVVAYYYPANAKDFCHSSDHDRITT
jgi:hypothetical protein